jgi:hypothetical protein
MRFAMQTGPHRKRSRAGIYPVARKEARAGGDHGQGREGESQQTLSRIARLDQRTALPDQCLDSAEADVRPPRRKSGFDQKLTDPTPLISINALCFVALNKRLQRLQGFGEKRIGQYSMILQRLGICRQTIDGAPAVWLPHA